MRLVTRVLAVAVLIGIGLSTVVRGQGGIASASARFLVSPQQVVAIRAGRLFDGRSGSLVTNQILLIRGDRITDVVLTLPDEQQRRFLSSIQHQLAGGAP